MNILDDPSRVYNCNETAFFVSPKENKVIVKKGEKVVYNFINNDEKECLTTLTTPTASELSHINENTNLNNAELNMTSRNFIITQDRIDGIFPNGLAAPSLVEDNSEENIEPNSSMTNVYQQATEVLIQPEVACNSSNPVSDIESTAAKNGGVPVNIPSPFKSSLFWPAPKLSVSKTKPKLKLPSTATSDSWRQYHQKKEEEKQRQLQEKEERKRKREENAAEKANIKKNKKQARRKKSDNEEESTQSREEGNSRSDEDNAVNVSYPSDEEENNNSESENDSGLINHARIDGVCENDIEENNFVVVCYDNQYYWLS
nr:chromatin assembly factor 1 subunit A-like [Leptinotarsa decemlineata]